jgi:threonine synthase
MIVTATAHPAKFADAIQQATGTTPPMPERLARVFEKKERYTVMPNDLSAVQDYVRKMAEVGS